MVTKIENVSNISVIIPCYNSVETIERAVESVTSQSMLPREIILVDDNSDDETYSKLLLIQQRLTADFVRLIRLDKNCGPSVARNTGWDIAISKYIAFLDADDSWHPDKLKIQYSLMASNENLVVSGHWCKCSVIGDNGFNDDSEPDVVSVTRSAILKSNVFKTSSTVMLKADVCERFSANKRYSEDYHLLMQLILRGGEAAIICSNLCYQFKAPFGEGGLSRHLWKMEKGELDVYYNMWLMKRISVKELLIYSSYSLIKYMRRCLIVALN